MPLRVIGAGLPRTGTNSLQLALNRLGFGPCHHMYELLGDPSQWPQWLRVYHGERVDWEDVYKGYNSAVDAPASFLWRELSTTYPDAKVILTTRSPDSWRRSMVSAGAAIRANPPEPSLASFMQKSVDFFVKLSPAMLPPDDASAFAAFSEHNETVRRTISKERLLVFDVRDGWEPLCRFLSVPVPEEPFPRKNTADEFAERARSRSEVSST
jgi:Sulfotransferase domain